MPILRSDLVAITIRNKHLRTITIDKMSQLCIIFLTSAKKEMELFNSAIFYFGRQKIILLR